MGEVFNVAEKCWRKDAAVPKPVKKADVAVRIGDLADGRMIARELAPARRLPSSEIVMHSTLTDPKSRAALRTLAAAFREHRAMAG